MHIYMYAEYTQIFTPNKQLTESNIIHGWQQFVLQFSKLCIHTS